MRKSVLILYAKPAAQNTIHLLIKLQCIQPQHYRDQFIQKDRDAA